MPVSAARMPEAMHSRAVRLLEPLRFAVVGRARASVREREGKDRECAGEREREEQRGG